MWSNKTKAQKGQSLLEVVIVISVGIIVVSALVFATISGLRNAQFAKNQAVATKWAQEGLEQVKGMRDRNEEISFTGLNEQDQNQKSDYPFSELWNYALSSAKCNSATKNLPCTFYFNSSNENQLTRDDKIYEEDSTKQFQRQVFIGDETQNNLYQKEKIVTVVVKWTDFSGDHESRLSTILRNLNAQN